MHRTASNAWDECGGKTSIAMAIVSILLLQKTNNKIQTKGHREWYKLLGEYSVVACVQTLNTQDI